MAAKCYSGLNAYVIKGYIEFVELEQGWGLKVGAQSETLWRSHYDSCRRISLLEEMHVEVSGAM